MKSEGPYSTGDSVGLVFKDSRGVESFDSERDKLNACRLANAAHAEGRKAVKINTPCPSCGFTTLCVDDSGNLVCSFLECKNPTEISNREGRKAMEKDFRELLELAEYVVDRIGDSGPFGQMHALEKFRAWKKARGIE